MHTRWKRNFGLDIFQALPHGVLETMAATFVIVIANKVFGFGPVEKIIITASPPIGFFVSLFLVPLVRRIQLSVNKAAAISWGIGAVGFIIAALANSHGVLFLLGTLIATISLTMTIPLIAQVHRKLYPDDIRGTLFSIGGLVRSLIAGVFAWAAGRWLDDQGLDYSPLFYLFAVCCLLKGVSLLMMDEVKLRDSKKFSIFESFKHVKHDAAFRKLLITWMLLGFGNLICMVLFVDYITDPDFGYNFDSEKAALITSTIPMAVFVVLIVPWGLFFDKVPFYRLRVFINVFFAAGILIYFLGNGFWALAIGKALHAIGKSGGKVVWSLWVTKFASEEHVSEYMSVHTFLTGVRGILSPVIAFGVIWAYGPGAVQVLAVVGAGLIVLSSIMLIPELLKEAEEQKSICSSER